MECSFTLSGFNSKNQVFFFFFQLLCAVIYWAVGAVSTEQVIQRSRMTWRPSPALFCGDMESPGAACTKWIADLTHEFCHGVVDMKGCTYLLLTLCQSNMLFYVCLTETVSRTESKLPAATATSFCLTILTINDFYFKDFFLYCKLFKL